MYYSNVNTIKASFRYMIFIVPGYDKSYSTPSYNVIIISTPTRARELGSNYNNNNRGHTWSSDRAPVSRVKLSGVGAT